jgi:hypothetical protein
MVELWLLLVLEISSSSLKVPPILLGTCKGIGLISLGPSNLLAILQLSSKLCVATPPTHDGRDSPSAI